MVDRQGVLLARPTAWVCEVPLSLAFLFPGAILSQAPSPSKAAAFLPRGRFAPPKEHLKGTATPRLAQPSPISYHRMSPGQARRCTGDSSPPHKLRTTKPLRLVCVCPPLDKGFPSTTPTRQGAHGSVPGVSQRSSRFRLGYRKRTLFRRTCNLNF